MTLYDLAEGIRKCSSCPLYKNRLLAIPGEGSINSRIMIIGDYPSKEDDRRGIPFSDSVLIEMLKEVGINKKDFFMTNLVKCHGKNNTKSYSTCKNLWLEKQIGLIEPKIIVLMGSVVLNTFLRGKSLKDFHGRLIDNYFITLHPKFIKNRKVILKDFKRLKKVIDKL